MGERDGSIERMIMWVKNSSLQPLDISNQSAEGRGRDPSWLENPPIGSEFTSRPIWKAGGYDRSAAYTGLLLA